MYLPFMDTAARPTLGLKPLPHQDWIDIDEDFDPYLRRKAELLAQRYDDVFVARSGSEAAQAEALNLIVEHLLTYFPGRYEKSDQAITLNLDQHWSFAAFDSAPLDLAARLVQEDLCILLPGATGYELAAASVCFPLRWNLPEKLGQPLGHIHQHVPTYGDRLERPVDNVFSRLRDGYPGLRFNWTIVDSPELFLNQEKSITQFAPEITATNAGQKLWLRVERQTICRLPMSGGVLFTIRTYVYPLERVVQEPAVASGLATAVTQLMPEMQKYKNLLPFRSALLDYLAERSGNTPSIVNL
ncbi:MAG: DUF3445 domain-containing protein [Elainellaceae cyanobacterium]